MSKVVRSVGRAVSSVVNGVVKAVKSVTGSGFGKLVLGGALMYFGAPMISGAIKGISEGNGLQGMLQGAVSGAGDGIASAWRGLADATSAVSEGRFGDAGTSLMNGMMGPSGGVSDSGGGTETQGIGNFGSNTPVTQTAPTQIPNSNITGAPFSGSQIPRSMGYDVPQTDYGAPAAKPSGLMNMVGSAAEWIEKHPRLSAAGLMMASSLMQASAKRQQMEDERDRARQNWSVGGLQTSWRR